MTGTSEEPAWTATLTKPCGPGQPLKYAMPQLLKPGCTLVATPAATVAAVILVKTASIDIISVTTLLQ